MANDETTVTIDGPAGSGKTTVAGALAKALGYRFLDTGAMYRAATLAAIRAGVADPSRPSAELPEDEVVAAAQRAQIDLLDDGHVMLCGIVAGSEIRTAEVDAVVSAVSALPGIRMMLRARQQEFGVRARPGLVAEGRDMATVVFPHARHRFYLEADVRVRAKRRWSQLSARAVVAPALDEIIALIQARDEADSSRKEAPLRKGEGVVVVNTDALDVPGVVAVLSKAIAAPRRS
jgi:CMP/dCMP kinase